MESSRPKIKLAYVVKYYRPMPRISGILTFVSDLVDALSEDFSIRVFTYRYSAEVAAEEEYHGYRIVRLKSPFPWKAGRAVRSFGPELVIFGSGFWRPYLLLPYWSFFRAGLGPFSAPVILTQYTNMEEKFSFCLRLLQPAPRAIIATTEPLRELWEKYYPNRVSYIPPGLRLPPPEGEIFSKKKKLRIGYFGHLQCHKGPDTILKIFQEINPPEAELLINGEGELLPTLAAVARGWENITIVGYRPTIYPRLRSCDLVVLPYRSAVSVLGYSRVALEALALGIPLLTTPNAAVAPLVMEGENGFICRSEAELKEKLEQFITDPQLRKKLSQGTARDAGRFNIDRIAAQYRNLILSLLRGK